MCNLISADKYFPHFYALICVPIISAVGWGWPVFPIMENWYTNFSFFIFRGVGYQKEPGEISKEMLNLIDYCQDNQAKIIMSSAFVTILYSHPFIVMPANLDWAMLASTQA